MEAGGGDRSAEPTPAHFGHSLFFGFDFEFQKYISKNSQLLFSELTFLYC
jgi:hypothetical protein